MRKAKLKRIPSLDEIIAHMVDDIATLELDNRRLRAANVQLQMELERVNRG